MLLCSFTCLSYLSFVRGFYKSRLCSQVSRRFTGPSWLVLLILTTIFNLEPRGSFLSFSKIFIKIFETPKAKEQFFINWNDKETNYKGPVKRRKRPVNIIWICKTQIQERDKRDIWRGSRSFSFITFLFVVIWREIDKKKKSDGFYH